MNAENYGPTNRFDTNQAYLIRLWQDGDHAVWRASAQSVQSRGIVRLASLKALFAFLENQTHGEREDDRPF